MISENEFEALAAIQDAKRNLDIARITKQNLSVATENLRSAEVSYMKRYLEELQWAESQKAIEESDGKAKVCWHTNCPVHTYHPTGACTHHRQIYGLED